MMKSFFKKLAFIMALAMVVSLAAPAAQASAAEKKEFTYAYQLGGKVTKLNMEAGDKIDLKFVGVKDYKEFAANAFVWSSLDEEVATVDKNGVVTAVADGTTFVQLKIKGSNYTSKAVEVVVGEELAPVVLGTAKDDTFAEYELAAGTSVDLDFFGVPNYNKTNYSVVWISNAPEVAVVDAAGLVAAVAEGTATVTAAIVNNITGDTLTVIPVVFTVVPAAEVEPTVAPEVTETPEPTVDPEVTETPEPTEAPAPLELTAKQTAINKVDVTFSNADAATDKVELFKLSKVNDEYIEMPWPSKVSVKDGVATVESLINFVDGDQFVVKAAGETVGFTAFVGEITSIKVVAKNVKDDVEKCYVNEEIKFVVSYYAGDIQVDKAATNAWVTFETVTPNDNIYIDGSNGLTSYIYAAGAAAEIKAVYNYYDKDYNVKTLEYNFTIVGENRPAELFKAVNAYTITNEFGDASKVAWGNNTLVIGDTGYKVGLNVGTTINKTYSVNTIINKVDPYDTAKGVFSFESSDDKVVLVGTDGSVTGVNAGEAYVIVKYATYDANNNLGAAQAVYAFPITVKPARTATYIKLSTPSVTVLTKDNAGNELTKVEVTYEVQDQYFAPYSVTTVTAETTAKVVTNALAVAHNGTKGTITVYGTNYADENVSNVAYTVAIKDTKVKTTLNVIPRKPATTTTDDVTTVVTNGYLIEAGSVDINVKAEKLTGNALLNTITAYTTWSGTKTGYVADLKKFDNDDFFTKNDDKLSGLKKDDIVIKITGPDGKLVTDYSIANGKLTFTVATMASGSALSAKATGFYNVNLYSVTNVTKNTGNASGTSLIAYRPLTSASFEIKNTTLKTTVKSLKTGLTSTQSSMEAVVYDLVEFQFDGKDIDPVIEKINGRYNAEAGKCYVDSVVVRTYITDTNSYFTETLPIKEVFTVNKTGLDLNKLNPNY